MNPGTLTGRPHKPHARSPVTRKPVTRKPMTPWRWLTLAVGLPVLVALIGWTGLSLLADAGTGSYQLSSALPVTKGAVTADFTDANVTLVPGSSARLTGTLTYSLIRPDVTIRGSSVSYRCPMPAGQCALTSTLSVPPRDDVNLSSAAGDLTVNGGLGGNMTLSTGTGDLSATNLAGGNARLTTTDGDISATGITAADVTASSVAGDVSLTFVRVPGNVTVTSSYGDVSIVLPRGKDAYRVVTGDGTGDVSVTMPEQASSSHVITVSSKTGDISITTG